jgi:hypothetical protein
MMGEIYNLNTHDESDQSSNDLPIQGSLETLKFWYKPDGDPALTHDVSRLAEKFRDLSFRKKSIYRSHKRVVEKNPEDPDGEDQVCYYVYVEPPKIGCAIKVIPLIQKQDPSEIVMHAFSFLVEAANMYGLPVSCNCQTIVEGKSASIEIKLFFNLSKA